MRGMLRHPVRFVLDHRFARAHASDYLDDALDDDGRRRVDRHTEICPPCHRFVESLRATLEALSALRARSDGELAERVIGRLRAEP